MDRSVPVPLLDEYPLRSGPIALSVGLSDVSPSATAPLKRSASEAFDHGPDDETTHKKLKDSNGNARGDDSGANPDGATLSDNLEEELQCGCCSAIVYRPVVVNPCQHFFCGRCVHTHSAFLASAGAVVLKLLLLRGVQLRYALDQGK